MAVRVNNDTFAEEISSGTVIADFYSDTCIPCKRMSPILAEVEEETGVKLVKLNINFDGETAEKYDVTAVPTIILFKDGNEKARIIGAVKKADITDALSNL